MRTLTALALTFAAVVAVASILPYTAIIPRRSAQSFLVGGSLLVASYAECFIAPLMARRMVLDSSLRTVRNGLSLTLGALAAVPAVVSTIALA